MCRKRQLYDWIPACAGMTNRIDEVRVNLLCPFNSGITNRIHVDIYRTGWDSLLMCAFPGAPPTGALRASKSTPGRFVKTLRKPWMAGRDKSSGQTICTAPAARRVAPRDGRNERTWTYLQRVLKRLSQPVMPPSHGISFSPAPITHPFCPKTQIPGPPLLPQAWFE